MTAVVEANKCRVCGCTDSKPCLLASEEDGSPVPCYWIDFDHTLCSNLRCIGVVPLSEILSLAVLR